MLDRNRQMLAQNPELRNFGIPLPTTREEFGQEVTSRLKAEHDDAMDVLQLGGGGAEFLGRMWAGATDQSTVLSLPFGASAGARLLTVVGVEAAVNAGAEALLLERQFETAERLDLPTPNVAGQLGMAALTGGLIGGGIAGALRYSQYRSTRNAALGGQRPPGAPQLGFGDDVARAGRQMRGDAVPPEPSSAGTMGGILGRDAPGMEAADAELPAFDRVIEAGRGFTVVQSADGTAQRREGARNWRNHNPGNIEYGDFARRHGAIGTDGRFAVFPTYEAGRAAKAALLFESGAYRNLSIADAINRYAPPSENNTGAYISVVARAVGVSADTHTASLTPAQRQVMLDAMERHEGFKPGKVNGVQASARQRGGASADAGSSSFSGYSTRRGYTATGQVSAGDGFRIDVEYQVVDLASLQRASGDLQPRDRSRASSDEQISAIAAGLDPARLMPSPEADRGAPIVGPDSMVESGNGRVAAIDRAYNLHPDRADAYRQQIIAAGFEIPEGMQRPVLIGRRTSDLDGTQRQGFVRAANTSQIARMSATERAAMDARGINSETVALYDPTQGLNTPANAPFTRRVLDSMPQAERSGLVDATGKINAEGLRRIRDALFARAYDAPDIVARYAETEAGELKSLLDALAQAAPEWAALRQAVAEGRIRAEMDITPFVLDAMRTIALAREVAAREGGKLASVLDDMLAQVDLLEGNTAPLTVALIRKFAPNGRAARAETIAEFLKRYAAEAQKIGGAEAALFDAPGPLDALKAIDKAAFGDLTEIGRAAVPPAPEPEIRLDDIPEDAFAAGAASPEVEAADAIGAQQLRDAADMTPPRTLQEVENPRQALADLKASQPFETVDQLYELAPAAQSFLEDLGVRVADDLGITFKTPGLKVKATALEKMQRKAYETAQEMTDVARGGFLVNTAEDADRLVARLAAAAGVLDEGWSVTNDGYFDRKVLVQTPNGVVAEVQIWSPAMLEAKNATGHALYERYRSSGDAEESEALMQQMRDLYSAALSRDDASFAKLVGTSNSPKVLANQDFSVSAESSTRAVWDTSAASTGTQSPPGLRSASASFREAENSTAGRPSQSVNTGDVMGDTSGSNVDAADLDDKALQELQAFAAEEFELESGIRLSVREMLDDIDQDDALATVVDLCGVKGKA
ncbi:hypothetical protein [Salipiger marinus]|uniref:hypothetical protein n=1 Tax=Salipiger marinus TaxID=555512 RepID=UPI0010424B98|nr:hypothetical protein [Salipiger marinus]